MKPNQPPAKMRHPHYLRTVLGNLPNCKKTPKQKLEEKDQNCSGKIEITLLAFHVNGGRTKVWELVMTYQVVDPLPAQAVNRILFEPWALGDTIIATANIPLLSGKVGLACHARFHSVIRALHENNQDMILLPVSATHTVKKTERKSHHSEKLHHSDLAGFTGEVFSIRGDIRDAILAKRLMPKCKLVMSGWSSFLARRHSIFDIPFRLGIARIRNRYIAWSEILGVPDGALDARYQDLRKQNRADPKSVLLCFGAQWQSKQYPFVAALRARLEVCGLRVSILGSKFDFLPPGVEEKDVLRENDAAWIRHFRSNRIAITNDSGAMHAAAAVGCQTIVISNLSNINEWIPPGVLAICSSNSPRGYMPKSNYMTDQLCDGWPNADMVAAQIMRQLS